MSVAQRETGADGLRKIIWGLVAGLAAVVLAAPAQAEDLKGRWYFGGHLGYLSTTDNVRSNADIIIGPLGDDNIPFTGDPNEEQGCVGALSSNTFCDPRPDDLLSRETSIEETFRAELDAGFGITSWLNLQLDASYFKGDVGPVDTFLRDHFPIAGGATAGVLDRFADREQIIPVEAGTITEIPVSLTAILRFRKDSPLNPYVGVGFGMIFANIERSSDVDDLNDRIASMRIRGIENEFNVPIGDPNSAQVATGTIPFRNALLVDVNDAFEWHITAGAEYFFNDRLSMIFDAKYMFADDSVRLDLGGEDQINLLIFSENLFRPDGTTKIFAPTGSAPNTACEAVDWQGIGCDPYTRPAGKFVNPTGKDWMSALPMCGQDRDMCRADCIPTDPSYQMCLMSCDAGYEVCIRDDRNWQKVNDCPGGVTINDFDRDGKPDQCYGPNVGASPSGIKDPRGDVIVQGGKINLTAFSFAIGLRFHF